jgi:hypothetical protein
VEPVAADQKQTPDQDKAEHCPSGEKLRVTHIDGAEHRQSEHGGAENQTGCHQRLERNDQAEQAGLQSHREVTRLAFTNS